MTAMAFPYKERWIVSLLSAAGWTAGGHYMGLAADKDGDFHPFWVDARSGTSQIYTARVSVQTSPASAAKPGEGAAPPASSRPAAPALGDTVSVAAQVELVFDPPQIDTEKNEISIPIRLKNVSTTALYPPLRLEFSGFGSGDPESEQEKDFWKDKMVTVVNSENGRPGEGAVFRFDQSLASAEALEPGALTNPVVVRLKLSDPFYAPTMRWNVTGRVARTP
jgi:hypothetical protein